MILKSKLDKQAGAQDQSFLIEKLKQKTQKEVEAAMARAQQAESVAFEFKAKMEISNIQLDHARKVANASENQA